VKINAIMTLIILILVMTISVLSLTVVAVDRVKNLPQPVPLAPAADSLEAVGIIIPNTEPMVESVMIERPLFWKERQPYVVELIEDEKAAPEVIGPDPFEKIKLVGVYSGGAILIVDGVKQRIHIGEELVVGWSLELMSAEGLIFRNGEESKTLKLEHAMVTVVKSNTKDASVRSRNKTENTQQQEKTNETIPSPTKQQITSTNNTAGRGRLPMPEINK